jgi:hypothetical protein
MRSLSLEPTRNPGLRGGKRITLPRQLEAPGGSSGSRGRAGGGQNLVRPTTKNQKEPSTAGLR